MADAFFLDFALLIVNLDPFPIRTVRAVDSLAHYTGGPPLETLERGAAINT